MIIKTKSIAILLGLGSLFLLSSAHAVECKIRVGYGSLPFDRAIKGYENFVIHENSSLNTQRKHMRKITNNGDRDVKISYWDVRGNHTKTINKGTSVNISGDLRRSQCLNTIAGRQLSYTLACNAGGRMKLHFAMSQQLMTVDFIASQRTSRQSPLQAGQCSWTDRTLRRNEPRRFCHSQVNDIVIKRNANGFAFSSRKAPYLEKMRIGGSFSLQVRKEGNCLKVVRAL